MATKTSTKADQITSLATEIIDQQVCDHLAKTATQLVMGNGNLDAQVVFIGEAPGKAEDIAGKPFVGAAGKFLDTMIESIGFKRSDVYITNIVKYRPPDNRDPEPDEIAAFLPYLLRQLDIIAPKLIVTLGRHSMSVFLPGLRISQIHGQPKSKSGRVIMPLYHPAAALYNGGMRDTLLEDFARIPATLELLK